MIALNSWIAVIASIVLIASIALIVVVAPDADANEVPSQR